MEYGSHSVVIHTIDTGTAVKLGGITSMGVPLNTETANDDSGALYDSFGAINFQAPVPQFTTKSIALALGAIPQAGICINADGSHPGVKLYGEAKGDCQEGEPESDDHLSYLIDLGLIVPLTLTCDRRGDASLAVEIDAITDGTNAPFAYDYGDTLPTGVDRSVFALGAMRIGNILWDTTRNFNLAFGVSRLEKEPQLGGIWPYRSGRRKAQPIVTLTARDPRQLDDSTGIPLLGKEATHVNTTFYFKKRKNRAAFEADGDLVHSRLTVAGLVYFDNPFSASGTAPAETSVTIKGLHDGTNTPLIWTNNVAYDPTP